MTHVIDESTCEHLISEGSISKESVSKKLQSGLQVAFDKVGEDYAYQTVLQAELPFPTHQGLLCHDQDMADIYEQIEQLVASTHPGAIYWQMLIAYDGRCWFLEPSREEGSSSKFALGYFDFPNNSEWNVIGVNPIE